MNIPSNAFQSMLSSMDDAKMRYGSDRLREGHDTYWLTVGYGRCDYGIKPSRRGYDSWKDTVVKQHIVSARSKCDIDECDTVYGVVR